MEDFRFQGEIGQKLGEALLLRFLGPARPEPDLGIDAVAVLQPKYCSNDAMAGVFFNFQFKTGALSTDSANVVRWMTLTDQQPVFLVEIKAADTEQQRYRFLSVHEWMIQNPDLAARITTQKTVSFPRSNFQQVDPRGENFLAALKDEANRVNKHSSSLWRTRPSPSPYLPVAGSDLFRHFGRLPALEASAQLVANMRDGKTLDLDVWHQLHDMSTSPNQFIDATQSPEVRHWLNGIASVPSKQQIKREIQEFRRFRKAMLDAAHGKLFDFPGFTYGEVSCWRIFMQLYPESLLLLKPLAKYPDKFSAQQLMAAFQLLSTLTSSGDASLAAVSRKLLGELSARYLSGRADDFRTYTMLRQLHYNLAEADGGRKAVRQCIDFIHAHPLEWDFELNRRYYGEHSDAAFVRSSLSKLEYPKERDLRTKRIAEFFLGRFSDTLIGAVHEARRHSI